jgi:hypothetical protein
MVMVTAVVYGVARAQTPTPAEQRARVHFDRGQSYFEQSQYERAIAEFQTAYRLKPIPLILFDIGNVARVAGMHDRALDYFKRYLAVAPANARERPEAEHWLRTLGHEHGAHNNGARHGEAHPRPLLPQAEASAEPLHLIDPTRATALPAVEPRPAPSAPANEPAPAAPTPAAPAPAAPPPVVTAPAPEATPTPPKPSLTLAAAPPPPARKPLYKRWWLWTTVVLVAGGVGVGLWLWITQPYPYPPVTTGLGTFRF